MSSPSFVIYEKIVKGNTESSVPYKTSEINDEPPADVPISIHQKHLRGVHVGTLKRSKHSRAFQRRIPGSTCSRCRNLHRPARDVCCTSPARCAPGSGPTHRGHPESSLVRSERGCRVPGTQCPIDIRNIKSVDHFHFIFYSQPTKTF